MPKKKKFELFKKESDKPTTPAEKQKAAEKKKAGQEKFKEFIKKKKK